MTGEGTSLDYSYNGNNRLVEVDSGSTVNTYVYDGRNRRVKADDGTVEMTYYYSALGMSLEQEDGVDHAAYVRLPGGQQMAIFGPDGDFYYLYDGSGNIIGIIDDQGNAEWYDYFAFGQELDAPSTPSYNPYRFAGAYTDDEGGKTRYYMLARYMDPEHGRFGRPDPLEAAPTYGYGANNPMIFTDPDGHCVKKVSWSWKALAPIVDLKKGSLCDKAMSKATGGKGAIALHSVILRRPHDFKTARGLKCNEKHEAVHIWHQRIEGPRYFVNYVIGPIRGYRNNPYERIARGIAGC